jgi:hypothetical protein
MTRFIALFGCLAAAFALFYAAARTPAPAPADAPAGVFSAGRAMVDVAAMAPVPHPVGSPANHKVRDYLIGRMRGLGLDPRIQRDVGVGQGRGRGEPAVTAAEVENLIGRLPGRDPSLPALVLMAHYDSVPGSPGAADDVASVATILEIVRLLKTEGVPTRDVMVVFTDGEEAGLLGAHAFFADDPAAAHAGFILNMETRGGGGRAAMFETGPGNGAAIDLYRRTAVRPLSNSLTVFIYKLMPNDTDFTVSKAKGLPGFNYAFIGRQFDYHSPSSTVAALDQGSVQQMGDQAAPTARALAFADRLPQPSADAAYGDLLGLTVLAYPAWAGWIVLALAAALTAAAALGARRAGALSAAGVFGGLGAGPLLLVAAALGLHLARRATGVGVGWIEYRPLLARFPVFEAGMALAGLAAVLLTAWAMARGRTRLAAAALAIALGLAGSAFGGLDAVGLGLGLATALLAAAVLSAPAERAGTWVGLLAGGLIGALGLQIAAPSIAPVLAWPTVMAGGAAALTLGGTSARRLAWAAAGGLIIVGLAWLGGLFHQLLQGLDVPEAPALVVWLAALSLWPLAWPSAPQEPASLAPGAAVAVLALAVMGFLHLTSPWTVRHPRAVEPRYLVDAGTGQAWRVSMVAPDAWSLAVLGADGGKPAPRRFPTLAQPVMAAPARAVAAAPPAFSLQTAADGTRTLSVAPAPGADHLVIDLRADAAVTATRVDGRPVRLLAKPGQWSHLRWSGSDQSVTLSFRPAGPGTLEIAYAEGLPGWPAAARPLPPMPARDMGWNLAGDTVVVGARRLAW